MEKAAFRLAEKRIDNDKNNIKALHLQNPFYVNQLNEDQILWLNSYYMIIRGGIAKRIRAKIEEDIDKNLSEGDIYGESERALYTTLINTAHILYISKRNIEEDILRNFKDPKPFELFSLFREFYIHDVEFNNKT